MQSMAEPDPEYQYFIPDRELENVVLTVVNVEELTYVPQDGKGWRIEKTDSKRFTYDDGSEEIWRKYDSYSLWSQKVGDKMRRQMWSTIYAPTGRLSYIQQVKYSELYMEDAPIWVP